VDAPGLVALVVGAASAGALGAAAAAAWQAARRPRVLCLMYHRVAPREAWLRTRGTERVFTVAEDALDAQLGWLAAEGWRFVDPEDVAAFARGERTLPDRSVLVTVDDGCASGHALLLPLLRRHGARAAFFVTTDPASPIFALGEGERRMTDAELRALAGAGCTIGSHAVSHRPLAALPDDEVRRELAESRRVLEDAVGRPVVHFAVPSNWWDARVLRLAREAGYTGVWCSRPDTVRAGSGAFPIPRLNVEGGLDLAGFRRALSPAGIAQRRLVMGLRGLPKRLLGPGAWTRIRRRLLAGSAGHWLSPRRMARVAVAAAGAGLAGSLCWWLLAG